MAKSKETYAKREREKKRLKKKQEKREKREYLKANAEPRSADEMIAYVDEFGNLTDTPPDPNAKSDVKLEDIQTSIPKLEDRRDPLRTGLLTYFDTQKGFGFIQDKETQEKVFVHINEMEEPVAVSEKVFFETVSGPRGLSAVNVRKQP